MRSGITAYQMQSITGYLFRCTPEELGATLAAIRSGHGGEMIDPGRAALADVAADCPGLLPLLDELETKKHRLRLQKWSRKRKPKQPQPDGVEGKQ